MQRFFFALLIGTVCIPLEVFAATDVTVSERINLVLPNDNSTYTLEPSTFNTLTVNSDSFSFSMRERATVEMVSAQSKNLANDQSPTKATIKCSGGESRVILVKDPGASNQTVTVTPSGTCSSSSGSSPAGGGSPSIGSTYGGGGGGGGGAVALAPSPAPSPSPAPVPPPAASRSTLNQIAQINQQIAELQAKIKSKESSKIVFVKNLIPGQRNNEDVKRLQELLAGDKSIYPEGIANGYFGPGTVRAVKRFQAKYGIAQLGNVGPATRKKLNEVFGGQTPEITPTTVAPAPSPKSAIAPVSAGFARNLTPGQRNNSDVKRLQEFLVSDKTLYPEGIANGYFGPATVRAVKRFQAKYGIAQLGSVGPATRKKLNEVFGK